MSDRPMEADLAAWGKVIRLRTTGRRSGLARTATVGFVEEPDGALLVAAASESTGWAANLQATPTCLVERDGHTSRYLARPLQGPERATAIASLLLKYGTPAERLGAGPAFRLTCEE